MLDCERLVGPAAYGRGTAHLQLSATDNGAEGTHKWKEKEMRRSRWPFVTKFCVALIGNTAHLSAAARKRRAC